MALLLVKLELLVVRGTNSKLSSGIGLETSILFAKEGASILMADISVAALVTAKAKVDELVPSASRVETMVRGCPPLSSGYPPSPGAIPQPSLTSSH